MEILTSVEEYVVYPFEKVLKKVPNRQKHFNTAIFVVIALILSEIPLLGGVRQEELSEVTFKVSGTLMQLGTQPFVFASMLYPFLFEKKAKNRNQTANVLGLFLSFIMAFQWSYNNGHWGGGLQLCGIAFLLLQSDSYLEERGSVQPTTALIFANAAKGILMSVVVAPVSFVWTVLLITLVAWIESLVVTVALTHMKSRSQNQSMPLPVMYNSTTCLIMYYTLVETISTWYVPSAVLLSKNPFDLLYAAPCLYIGTTLINKNLSTFNEQNGKDVVNNWHSEKYTLKGWRDPKKMYKYVQNIIDRNVLWNTIFICALWTLSILFPPAVGITTLFIMIGAVKRQKLELF